MQNKKVTYINKSTIKDPDLGVVIFQKDNTNPTSDIIAWKVINNCSSGWQHEFLYNINMSISYANQQQYQTYNKQTFKLIEDFGGFYKQLVYSGNSVFDGVHITNETDVMCGVNCFRNGILLGITQLPPTKTFVFNYDETIGVIITTNNIEEGDIIQPELLSTTINHNLSTIMSCDLVLYGDNIENVELVLENAVYDVPI